MCFMRNIYTLLIWCKADFIELGGEAHKTAYSSTQQMCKKLKLENVRKTACFPPSQMACGLIGILATVVCLL